MVIAFDAIFQIDGLIAQGRVNSWPLSWIQKLETAIKRKRENKNCENAKCHSVTTREYRGEENIQLLFRALLFVTNHNTVRQSKLPSCAVIGQKSKYLQKDKISVVQQCTRQWGGN